MRISRRLVIASVAALVTVGPFVGGAGSQAFAATTRSAPVAAHSAVHAHASAASKQLSPTGQIIKAPAGAKKTQWPNGDPCEITAHPAAFPEAGEWPSHTSSVAFVFEVECLPVYGESYVEIDTNQLYNICHGGLSWASPSIDWAEPSDNSPDFDVYLDDDGNATAVAWGGPSCAATTARVTATLLAGQYPSTATTVTIQPPHQIKQGVYALPGSEVEDSTYSAVVATFYAAFPGYTDDPVSVSDASLYNRCSTIYWYGSNEYYLGKDTKTVVTKTDNDGNAFVVAIAFNCTPGPTEVQADLICAPYTTVFSTFTVEAPRPTRT